MHLDEEIVQQEGGIITNQRFLRSCEKSVADSKARNGYHSSRHSQLQRNYYTSYWSKEAVTAALEVCVLCIWSSDNVILLFWCLCKSLNCISIRKISHPVFFLQKGDVFRALFRVNAHNRLEVCLGYLPYFFLVYLLTFVCIIITLMHQTFDRRTARLKEYQWIY